MILNLLSLKQHRAPSISSPSLRLEDSTDQLDRYSVRRSSGMFFELYLNSFVFRCFGSDAALKSLWKDIVSTNLLKASGKVAIMCLVSSYSACLYLT